MKRITVWGIVVALALVSVTYVLLRGDGAQANAPESQKHADPHGDAEAPHEDAAKAIAGLRIEPVTTGDSWDVVIAAGKVSPEADRQVEVGPRISGRIVKVHANAGDAVRAGQVLAVLSSVELAQARAAYRQAVAAAKAAQNAYARQKKLADLGAFSNRPVEEARSQLLSAQSELAQAKSEFVRADGQTTRLSTKLTRARELHKDQILSRQDLEEAEADARQASAELEAAQAEVAQCEARVLVAKSYSDREERVLGADLLASKELQTSKAELTASELELRATADALQVLGASPDGAGDTVPITSPIAGRVVARSVSLGEMVEPTDTLFRVMNLSDVWVEANVYEKDIAEVRVGQIVEVKVDSYSGRSFSGKVTHVGEVLDPVSRTAMVRCAIPNPSGLLKPEMFATITIITGRRSGAVLVPKEAVLDDAGKKVVFVACMDCDEDRQAGKSACGTFDRRTVELGPAHDGLVEVVKGLASGDGVVAEGAYQLKTALGSGTLEAGCVD